MMIPLLDVWGVQPHAALKERAGVKAA